MSDDHEILQAAFRSQEWREAVDALFEATGLVVTVMDSSACSIIHSTARCTYCDLAMPGSGSCFDDPPRVAGSITRTTCRAGLPCYIAQIGRGGPLTCSLVVGGFVSSTRERKRMFEKLLARGIPEGQARLAVREIPIITQRQVEALVRMAAVGGNAAVAGQVDRNRRAVRERELETIVEAGTEFIERRGMGQDLIESVLQRAMSIVGADSGSLMLLRPGTDLLEVVAPAGEAVRGAAGQILRLGEGIAGRVAESGRSVLITGDRESILAHSTHPGRAITTSVSVPLKRGERLIGVINLNISAEGKRLSGDDLALVERYARLAAATIDNARMHGATERAMYELMHLGELAKTLSGAADLEEVLSTVSSVVEKAFDFEVGGIALTGWGYDRAIAVVEGEISRYDIDHVIGEAMGRDTFKEPIEALRYVTHRGQVTEATGSPDEWTVISSEIIVRDSVVGYAYIAGRGVGVFDSTDYRLLEGLADHTSVALERAVVLSRLRDDLTRSIAALSASMDVNEHASPGHADRVMDYAMLLGEELELELEQIELLRFAGLLHDIGKSGISEEILLKPSRLSDSEMDEVRRHAEIGASIVEQIEFLSGITPIIMHHHERWDGEGYPMKLAAEEIPLLARILSIADSYDAMTSDSVYRRRLSYSEARRELTAGAGSQFDPRLVEAFLQAMDRRALAGSTGLMADRRTEGPQLPA